MARRAPRTTIARESSPCVRASLGERWPLQYQELILMDSGFILVMD